MNAILQEHLGYLRDGRRLDRFREAIARTVGPGDVVADLGCGFGVLGLMCLRAGAARVYGIDRSDAIDLARETMARAGLAGAYRCIRASSFRAVLPEPVDLIVCDHVGHFGLDYAITAMLGDARRRMLKPGGRIVPGAIRLVLAGLSSGVCQAKIEAWNEPAMPPEFGWLREYECNTKHAHTFGPDELCTAPAALGTIDLAAEERDSFSFKAVLTASRDTALGGLCGWFDCALGGEVSMTNSPLAQDRIDRDQACLPFAAPIALRVGDAVEATFAIRPEDGLLAWTARNMRSGERRRQSTWRSRVLDPDSIGEAAGRARSLGPEARARMLVAGLIDGKRSAREIEQAVLAQSPGLFPSEAETLRFIRSEIARSAR